MTTKELILITREITLRRMLSVWKVLETAVVGSSYETGMTRLQKLGLAFVMDYAEGLTRVASVVRRQHCNSLCNGFHKLAK
jgi:hypothetical protein